MKTQYLTRTKKWLKCALLFLTIFPAPSAASRYVVQELSWGRRGHENTTPWKTPTINSARVYVILRKTWRLFPASRHKVHKNETSSASKAAKASSECQNLTSFYSVVGCTIIWIPPCQQWAPLICQRHWRCPISLLDGGAPAVAADTGFERLSFVYRSELGWGRGGGGYTLKQSDMEENGRKRGSEGSLKRMWQSVSQNNRTDTRLLWWTLHVYTM